MTKDSKGPKDKKESHTKIKQGDSIVTLNETILSKDEDLTRAKERDRQWLLFEAADKETLNKKEVILTIKKLEKQLRPMGVVMKTWAKPGIK